MPMSVNVPSRLLRYNALGFESFATYKSTQPSLSKSIVLTPSPYVPFARVMPARSDTSWNVPFPRLWYSTFFPPVNPGGPHATLMPL